jgi:hypothetical protein
LPLRMNNGPKFHSSRASAKRLDRGHKKSPSTGAWVNDSKSGAMPERIQRSLSDRVGK